jgi:hypothetical protein
LLYFKRDSWKSPIFRPVLVSQNLKEIKKVRILKLDYVSGVSVGVSVEVEVDWTDGVEDALPFTIMST